MTIFTMGVIGITFGLGVWLLIRQENVPAIGFLGITAAIATFELLWLWHSAVGFKGAIARFHWGQFLIGTAILGITFWWLRTFGQPPVMVAGAMVFLSVWATAFFMNGASRAVEQLWPRK